MPRHTIDELGDNMIEKILEFLRDLRYPRFRVRLLLRICRWRWGEFLTAVAVAFIVGYFFF